MNMKVAVINFSGNVGKSTVARHLLAPRIPDATVIAVETINSDGDADAEAIKGKQFAMLSEALALAEGGVVVDVGASNVEEFLAQMKQYAGSHEDFDFYVVPVVPARKQQRDTLNTIDALAELGIPAKKIRLLFNQVEPEDLPANVFSGLFSYHQAEKNFTLRDDAVMHVSDIYSKLQGPDGDIKAILADDADYKELIKTSADAGEKLAYAQRLAVRRLASGVNAELDAVFKTLFAGK